MNYRKSRKSQLAVSELPCASVSKRVLVNNLSNESESDSHENIPVDGTCFHRNGWPGDSFDIEAKATRRRPIAFKSQHRNCLPF